MLSKSVSNLDAKYAEKFPKIKDDEREKWLVGAEILAYLKYLIYSAAFKDPTAEPRGSVHAEFYRTFRVSKDLIRRKMKKKLECWYAKHQPSNRRFLSKDDDNHIGVSEGQHPPVLNIYHDEDAELPQADAERGLGNVGVGI